MKNKLICFILLAFSLNLHAENGHSLWLRAKSLGTVNIVCTKSSPTLAIAKQELELGWHGQNGAKIVLTVKKDKAIENDGYKLSEDEIQANTELGILMEFTNFCVVSKQEKLLFRMKYAIHHISEGY